MAKTKREQELFDVLRARGLRKRVAKTIAATAGKKNHGRVPKPVRGALGDLEAAIGEVQARVSGKSDRRKAAAKKAAATRKRKQAKRSASAKKAARTRAKS
jgi:hypothetical protein